MKNLLTIDDLQKKDVENILNSARLLSLNAKKRIETFPGKILSTLFFEPSTRTRLSFQTAMYRLGGNVIDLGDNSSLNKGENAIDTIRTVSEYSDIMVIRHSTSDEKTMRKLASYSKVPVISAGNGAGEHPTQALLDLFTIEKYMKSDITIMFAGDLYYSRTVNSLLKLFKLMAIQAKVIYACPHLNQNVVEEDYLFINEEEIEKYLPEVDVLYMTRPQKERHSFPEYSKIPWFSLNNELVNTMKKDAIIMHPFPRYNEIKEEVDANPKAKYFDQITNGLYIRMALLNYML